MQHRKKVKHYHDPGDSHEFTFSCFQRRQLLDDDERCGMLCTSIDRALTGHDFRLITFVIMPEHVHLLTYPMPAEPRIDLFLKAVKRPFSYRVKQKLIEAGDPLLQELTIRERPGKMTFRFWQEGPGYDRNLSTEKAILAEARRLNPPIWWNCLIELPAERFEKDHAALTLRTSAPPARIGPPTRPVLHYRSPTSPTPTATRRRAPWV